jgi:adenosylmethionine-8-amino-7-oxononanoate aminotransferase
VTHGAVGSSQTRLFPPELDHAYPLAVRGEGVWLEDVDGNRYLDAMSGGSMVATLGYGRTDLIAAAREQGARLAYVHNELLTNPA